MIRINLLTSAQHSKPARSWGKAGMIAAIVAGSLVIVLGGVGVARHYMLKPAVVQTPPPPASDFKPSSHVRPNMVEDVVREIGDRRASTLSSGLLSIGYAEMSFGEKVCYEALFAKHVIQMLGRAVPTGIGLKTLEVQDFQTVYAVGLGSNKELVSDMFAKLKDERVELLSPPYSYIKQNGENGYRFVVTCTTRYGLDLSDPFQAIDHLPARGDLSILLKKLSQYAGEDGLRLRGTFKQVSTEHAGAFRRYIYNFSASGSYKDFVKFVLHLNNERMPCAFKTIKLSARTGTDVEIVADVLFTIRE